MLKGLKRRHIPVVGLAPPGKLNSRVSEEADLAIEQALSACHAGRGRAVLLSGPSGRGISRRLSRAADLARDRGLHVAVAGGRPGERSLAFSVAVELFEPLWRAAGPPPSRAELAGGPASAAVRLLDGSDPVSADGDGGFAITRGIWVLARRLAEQPSRALTGPPRQRAARPRGLAVVVDDLHDVDGPTLGLLAYAAHRLESSPVAILAGRRIDVEAPAPAALAAITRAAQVVVPEPLGAGAGAALVSSLLPSASARFVEACVAAGGGNAALLRALVLGLAARGWGGTDAEAGQLGAAVPDEVAGLVAQRLSRVPTPVRALLHAVSAFDRPIALEVAAAGAGLSTDAALEAFDELVAADVLVAELPLAFAQPALRTAVRASLTPGQRALHAPLAGDAARAGSEHAEALTSSEDRVAKLAARGMTTRQVAATLFVTPKTVEFHLRNVYRKLEIPSSRAELARALDAPDQVAFPT
jgi:DNA-binding CsgD family transcriptional regulator